MKNLLSLTISKRNLNKALRVLSVGAKTHKKYADVYTVAFRVDTLGKVTVMVPGGKFLIDAETSGYGCFALNYKWIKMYVKECTMKSLTFKLDSSRLTINDTVSVEVKSFTSTIDIPLSLSYSDGELARIDLTKIDEALLDFWGLTSQIEDAKCEIETVINKTYIQLAKHLPPHIASSVFKAKLKQLILESSVE